MAQFPLKPNAFRKFGPVRFPLYSSRQKGTYTGDADTFPVSRPRVGSCPCARSARTIDGPHRISGRVDATYGRRGATDTPSPPRTPATRPVGRSAASADLSRHEWRRYLVRSFLPDVWRTAGRQFLVGSARPPALGDLCRTDAAGLATPGHAAPASGRVLAGLAVGGAGWHAIQSDQHAADHGDVPQSSDAPRAGGVRQDHRERAAGTRAAQPPGGRYWAARTVGMGARPQPLGAPAQGRIAAGRSVVRLRSLCGPLGGRVPAGRQSLLAARPPRPQTARDPTFAGWQPPDSRGGAREGPARSDPPMAGGPGDPRARRPQGPSDARTAPVDQPAGCPDRAGLGTRALVCPPLGARTVFPAGEAAAAEDRGAAESYRRHRRTGDCGAGSGQCAARGRTRTRRGGTHPRLARELWQGDGVSQNDVAPAWLLRRPGDEPPKGSIPAARLHSHGPVRHRQTALAELPTGTSPTGEPLATSPAQRIGRGAAAL